MSNIAFIRERLSIELDRATERCNEYKNRGDRLEFAARFALEQHYAGKAEAYAYALSLLDLLNDDTMSNN